MSFTNQATLLPNMWNLPTCPGYTIRYFCKISRIFQKLGVMGPRHPENGFKKGGVTPMVPRVICSTRYAPFQRLFSIPTSCCPSSTLRTRLGPIGSSGMVVLYITSYSLVVVSVTVRLCPITHTMKLHGVRARGHPQYHRLCSPL